MQQEVESVEALRITINNINEPIAKRMRTVFLLKQNGTNEAIDALASALTADSILLAHESAYAIGQMRNSYAVPLLIEAVKNESLDVIVRHEAAEALGAILDPSGLPVLEEYSNDKHKELAETCIIALAKFNDAKEHKDDDGVENNNQHNHIFHSVDPAIPHKSKDVDILRTLLCDNNASLYDRYKAMFALRNLNTEESVLALCDGFNDNSALFKHEICYVLGQMAHIASMKALSTMIRDTTQHPMVRHEAAEALGNIDHEDVRNVLEECQKDENAIVSESCDVGLDIADYWSDNTQIN